MTWRERWGLVIGTSLILWGVSERAFWSLFRPDDNLIFIVIGIVPYAIATYLMYCAVQYFRISTFIECVLMGALYGWLIEGVVAMTLFGDGGIPFPITISWTGLAWHMLISVVVMLLWHRRVLTQSFIGSLVFALSFGVFWGVWSMTWFFETPPVINSVPLFAVHAAGVVGMMALGHWLMGRHTVTAFMPPRKEWIPIATITLLYFSFVTVQFVGVWVLILIALFGLLAVPLYRSRKRHATAEMLPILTKAVPAANLSMFLLTPAVATLLYALMLAGIVRPYPMNIPIFIGTSIAGALALAGAWFFVFRGEKR